MAIFRTSFVSILLFVFFMSATSLPTGRKLKYSDLKHLCSRTSNFRGCIKVLKSNNLTKSVDMKTLAHDIVDKASQRAKKIRSELDSLAKETHDSKAKNIYETCSKKYNEAIQKLETAKEKLKSGAYTEVHALVKCAHDEISSCVKLLGGSRDHAHMKKNSTDLGFHLSIVKAAADLLNKK